MEAIKVKEDKMYSLMALYDMHTDYFNRALDGISDTDAHNRLGTKANHVAWLAGSLVEQRYEGARTLGVEQYQTANELFKENKGIQDGVTYPSLEQYKKDWAAISPVLREKMLAVDEAWMNAKYEMPGMEMTNFELVSFMAYREANCIGQIALWRRLLGYPALNYM